MTNQVRVVIDVSVVEIEERDITIGIVRRELNWGRRSKVLDVLDLAGFDANAFVAEVASDAPTPGPAA